MRNSAKKKLGHLITLILMALLIFIVGIIFEDASMPEMQGEFAIVTRVIDGDTIEVELNGEIERVRLIGVDAPEMGFHGGIYETGATEATEFVQTEISSADYAVWLVASGNDRDKFGRLRRYVWLADPSDDHVLNCPYRYLLNQRLLDAGHAVIWE